MKRTTLMAVIALLIATATGSVYASVTNSVMSSLHPQELTRSQAAGLDKNGNIAVTQDGFTMDNQDLKDAVAKHGGKYYVIIGEQGHEDHKTIEADMYK